jgi:hypothetical protein
MLVQILLSQLCGFAESCLDIKLLFCALFLLTFYINLWEGTVLQIRSTTFCNLRRQPGYRRWYVFTATRNFP